MRKRDHNLLTNAVSLLICGLLAGVVVAAAAFPAVAMSGLAAKAGAETFDKLPSELKDQQAPQITRIFANDNKTQIAQMYDEFRNDVPLKDISKSMQDAIIAAEDHDFYKHNGVDVKGIARAFVANKGAGQTQQGASTLTMQYVRMSIAYSATHPADVIRATEDTNARKAREMRFALQVEKELTKEQILERYLNMAPFGNQAYGVFAASQVYFNKKPKDLNIEQAALLAGMVKAPTAFNPATKSGHPQALERRNYIINDMVEIGAITQEQATKAIAAKLSNQVRSVSNGCVSVAKNNWGFFCDYFYRWWLDQQTFGATNYDRERRLKSGGYRIVTSLDIKTQKAVHDNIEKKYKTAKNHPHALMEAAMEPGTGRVRALGVNRTFKLDEGADNGKHSDPKKAKRGIKGTYPNTTNPLLSAGGDINGYQGGSTFKIFTLVAALEQGMPLATTINAVSPYKSKFIVEYGGDAACPGTNKYCPRNSNPGSMNGLRNMWTGFGMSVNTYFIPLEERVGVGNVVEAAKKLGIKFRASNDEVMSTKKGGVDGWGAFTLGVSATTPLDLANAYATLAADGKYCEPTPVQQIQDHSGAKLDVANPRCEQRIKVETARAAVDAARCPVGDQSAFGKCAGATAGNVHGIVGHPVFGKSGTTDQDKTALLIAGTKSLVIAGMLADPDYAQTNRRMEHDVVNPAVYNALRDAMKGKPKQKFAKPNEKTAFGDQRSVPDVTCDSVDGAKSRLQNAGFEVIVDNDPVSSKCAKGTVAGTSPDGRAPKGGFVMLHISAGGGDEPKPGDTAGPPDGPAPPGGPGRPRR